MKLKNILSCLFIFCLSILFTQKTYAATLSFSPSSQTFPGTCETSVDIIVNATGQSSNAIDLEVYYDPNLLTIVDADSSTPGVQIREGNAYDAYLLNAVDTGSGVIKIAAASFTTSLTSSRVLATIVFRSNPGVAQASFSFDFDGVDQTLDSNVADSNTNLDLLTSVSNSTYFFSATNCVNDTLPPTAQFITPTPYQNDYSSGSIIIRITDDLSGIDLNSLSFIINGVEYSIQGQNIYYSGSNLDYTFTITPLESFPENEISIIQVIGQDIAGNIFRRQMVFNISEIISPQDPESEPCDCDEISGATPIINNIFGNNNSNPIKNTPLEGTIIDEVISNASPRQVSSAASTAFLTLSLLPAISFLNAPGLLLNIFGFVFGRKHRKPWGIVTDSLSGKPITFATCRLYKGGSTYVVDQTVTDLEGKYSFTIEAGVYRLEVNQSGYKSQSVEIEIRPNESSYVQDITLVPLNLIDLEKFNIFKKLLEKIRLFLRKSRKTLFIIGFTLSVISFILLPNTFNTVILILYFLIVIFSLVAGLFSKSKFASVVDSITGLRIPFAVIKVYDPHTWQVIDTQITNSDGKFDFWGNPGEYALLVAARGYKFPSAKYKNNELMDNKYSSMIKANLKKGRNDIVLLVDSVNPLEDAQQNFRVPEGVLKGNLPTPFG